MNADFFSWLVAAIVLGGAGWIAFLMARGPGGKRRPFLVVLRVLAGFGLAAMALQPQCRRTTEEVEKPMIGVLVDDSQSMNDGPAGQTRADAVRAWLARPELRQARARYDLRFFAFDRGLRDAAPDQLAFQGSESRISEAMREWAGRWRDESAAGLVVLSDGLDTTGGDNPPALDLPCWTFELEPDGAVKKERLVLWQLEPPRRALSGAESAVRVVLQGWGLGEREVPVEWWSEGRKIGERRLRFPADGDVVEAALPVPPMPPGTYPFELRIPDEAAEPAARSQPFVMVVRQEGRSVLLLENTMGFEGKFLRRALTSDRNLKVEAFTRWKDGGWAKFGDGDTSGGQAVLDLTPSALSRRSAVVLEDVEPAALAAAQWQALAGFADHGGGIVLLGGRHFLGSSLAASPMARVVPVPTPAAYRDGRFTVRMTEAGSRHAVFGPLFSAVGSFPTLQSGNIATGVAPNAQVLIESVVDGQARPLVVVKQQGEGRVAAVLTDTLWRWRVAGAGWTGRQSPYDTFWTQMLDWIAPEAEGFQSQGRLELTTDRSFYRQGDRVSIRAEWIARTDAPFPSVPVTLIDPAGQARPLTLQPAVWEGEDGRRIHGFRGEWIAANTGLHQAEGVVAGESGEVRGAVRFAVAAAVGERRGEPADNAFLRRLADSTRGAHYPPDRIGDWLDSLPKPTRIVMRERVVDVWNHPLLALALFGILLGEWWLRRKSYLP